MNMKRGFWRIWLVSTVLLVTTVFALSYGTIKHEFEEQTFVNDLLSDAGSGVPVLCVEAAKRNMGEAKLTATPVGRNQSYCWYPLSNIRKSWPEYSGRSDLNLMQDLYISAGASLPTAEPWSVVLVACFAGIGLPLAVLAFGWAVAGFAGAARKPS